MKKVLVILVALSCLMMSCATGSEVYVEARPWTMDSQTWWGMDPTCSPGCPPGRGGSW